MFRLIKKVLILIMSAVSVSPYCLLLKNKKCGVRKVIIDNDYMTFPYKIGANRCIEAVMMPKILILRFVYLMLLKILA